MAAKQLAFEAEARAKIREGVVKLARAVKATLGPRGRNAILDKGFGAPTVTKDGVTVAEEVELSDPYENMGAQMVREVASKTSDVAGDGTTTATLLAEAIFLEGLKHVTAGANPMALVRGLQSATKKVTERLKEMKRDVDDKNLVQQVATIAANGDEDMGKTIAKAFEDVGKDGVITVEEGKGLETKVNVKEGMLFDRGYISPHFVTDQETLKCELRNAQILIFEDKISAVRKLIPLLEKIAKGGKPLLIIAEDVEGEALATLVVNKLRGIVSCCAVKAPGYGDRRKAMLEDIAILTGGKPLFKDLGVDLENVTLADLGSAKTVRVTSEETTIVEGAGSQKDIKSRVEQIRREMEDTDSDYDKEKLQERLARLTGGVAEIEVGAATEADLKERKARVEDAVHATRAAVEEGILPGGGVALLRARKVLDDLKLEGDERFAADILRRALESPTRTIAQNAGLDGAVVARRIQLEKKDSYGYDALRDRYGDLFEFGIVDPTKVTRTALENAVSVAGLLLTTDVLVSEIPKEEDDEGGGGMPPM
ncbi:MAG: chaperonin GroEL [Planctomycetales bacterium]|nr:chaperonin GroEL [Planctomycetales bacterium]